MSAPADVPPRRVAVVGAGLAGLSCATALQAAGCAVQVLEKSRGPAGRMSTRRSDDAGGPWQCDHGAQYFTARDPAFAAEVRRWQDAGVAALWDAPLAHWDGQRWGTPGSALQRYVGTPRMTAPAARLAQQLDQPVLLQATVQQLSRSSAAPGIAPTWALATAEQDALPQPFDAVVLAVPAPQAVPLLRPLAPALADLAARVRMRGSWALMLRYDAPLQFAGALATLGVSPEGVFVNAGPLRWVARDSNKPGRGGRETWLLHATAEWSEAHIEESPEAAAAALLQAFAALGGPPPAAWTAHRWRYADTEAPLELGCAWDEALGLGLCGDWMSGGKVEGAWLSGQAMARRVLHPT